MDDTAWILEAVEDSLLEALLGYQQLIKPSLGQRRHRLSVLVLLYKVRDLRKALPMATQS